MNTLPRTPSNILHDNGVDPDRASELIDALRDAGFDLIDRGDPTLPHTYELVVIIPLGTNESLARQTAESALNAIQVYSDIDSYEAELWEHRPAEDDIIIDRHDFRQV